MLLSEKPNKKSPFWKIVFNKVRIAEDSHYKTIVNGNIQPIGVKAPILVSQKGTIFTIQAINRILKDIKKKYKVKIKNFSCHSLRKTFGRQVYNMNGDNAELALVKLSMLFNHSNVSITKRYLGIQRE